MGIICFFMDVIESIVDLWDTWREKDEKIVSKLIGTIITLGFLYLSAKLWL